MRVTLALTRVQFRLLRRDPWFLIIMFGMPLTIMPLFVKTMQVALASSGFDSATGAEQAVPGQVVVFSFFVAGSAGFSVFREHGWRTWDRLRASAVPAPALLAGYATPWIVIHVIYQATLLTVGGLLVGLTLRGSWLAELMILVSYSACVIAMVLLATATFRTINQVNAIVNLGAMVLGGLGGALVPVDQLPGWAQAISPLTPGYWAMAGHREVFLENGGLSDVLLPVVVLSGAALVFGAGATFRFKADETKEFFG